MTLKLAQRLRTHEDDFGNQSFGMANDSAVIVSFPAPARFFFQNWSTALPIKNTFKNLSAFAIVYHKLLEENAWFD